jgi:hypothetical protein
MRQTATIPEAAQLLGASEETVRDWIHRGLLDVHKQIVLPKSYPPGTLGFIRLETVEVVDLEQLYGVAEEEGWLMLAAEVWDDENAAE